jgi:hypothetical protein
MARDLRDYDIFDLLGDGNVSELDISNKETGELFESELCFNSTKNCFFNFHQ